MEGKGRRGVACEEVRRDVARLRPRDEARLACEMGDGSSLAGARRSARCLLARPHRAARLLVRLGHDLPLVRPGHDTPLARLEQHASSSASGSTPLLARESRRWRGETVMEGGRVGGDCRRGGGRRVRVDGECGGGGDE